MRALLLAAFLCAGCAENARTDAIDVNVELVGLGGATAGATLDGLVPHTLGTSVDLWSLAYRGQKAWAVGAGGAIFHSSNAGQTWAAQSSGTNARLQRVAFADDDNGIAIGELGAILSTHDGGASWVQMPASGKELPSAAAANGATWWVGSANGGLYRSTDGAQTFVKQSVPSGVYRAIDFTADGKVGLAVGDAGIVIRTTDSGETWTEQTRAPGDLVAVDQIPGQAFAVGKQGLVWHSTEAGVTWSTVTSNTTTELYDVALDSAANLWVVGQNAVVLHATNGGLLAPIANPTATTFTAVTRPSP